MLRPPQGLNRWRARGQGVRRAALNQPVKAGQRRAQASTIAQIKVTTAVMGAMVARRQQRLKMPRPDAYDAKQERPDQGRWVAAVKACGYVQARLAVRKEMAVAAGGALEMA